MNKTGFTLVEVLTVVVIIAVLTSIALPQYSRAIERSRATEAMSSIKAMNDSIYAYFAERNTCPPSFNKLVARVAGTDNADHTSISAKFFQFTMGDDAVSVNVPGTDCPGVVATRISGGGYRYRIWNPYTSGVNSKEFSLQCAPVTATDTKSIAVCESLGLYRDPAAN